NLLPDPKPPTEMPSATSSDPSPATIKLTDGTVVAPGPQGSTQSDQGDSAALAGAQYAPQLDPGKLDVTRLPLPAAAAVPAIAPPGTCAGYLATGTSLTETGLIRMPHVAQWFDTSNLTPTTPFEQEQATYISFTQYGSGVSTYEAGSPDTGSLANGQLKV